MNRKIVAFLLVFVMLFSCLSTAALADDSTQSGSKAFLDIINRIVELVKKLIEKYDITVGGIVRDVREITGYTDYIHCVSPMKDGVGQSVTLSLANKSGSNSMLPIGRTVKYQWYRTDCRAYAPATLIKGATAPTYETGEFTETGMYGYFCKITTCKYFFGIQLGEYSEFSPIYEVAYTGLPTIYLNTPDGKEIDSKEEWVKEASIEITGCDNSKYDLNETAVNVKGRGNVSWQLTAKNSYSLKFEDKQNLFGIGKDKKWALISNSFDKTLIRNWLAAQMDTEIFDSGSWNITQIPVDLVINGEYRGSYYLSSTIKIGGKRTDIPDIADEVEKDEPDLYSAGFIFEKDHMDETYNFNTAHGFGLSLSDPDLDDPKDTNEIVVEHVKKVIQTAEDALYADDFTDPVNGYAKYFDVDSFVDYYLIQEIAKNVDGNFKLSISMYYDPADAKIHMCPVWDFDVAFGNVNYDDCDDYHGIYCNRGWFGRMLEDPAFAAKVSARWDETKDAVRTMVNTKVQEQADKLMVSASLNFAKWPALGLPTYPSPDGYLFRQTYQSEIDYLVKWTNDRLDYLDTVL